LFAALSHFFAAGVGRGESVAHMFPLAISALIASQVFFVIKGLTKRGWRLTLLGLAMSGAALAVVLAPFSVSG